MDPDQDSGSKFWIRTPDAFSFIYNVINEEETIFNKFFVLDFEKVWKMWPGYIKAQLIIFTGEIFVIPNCNDYLQLFCWEIVEFFFAEGSWYQFGLKIMTSVGEGCFTGQIGRGNPWWSKKI